MDLTLMVQFWTVAVLLALTPGADWAYAIAAGLRARSVMPSIAGMLLGYACVVTVVALGAGALVSRYPAALTVLTLAGGAYLIFLGVTTLAQPVSGIAASERPIGGTALGQLARGAGVSGINPKGLLLLLALLPQFTSRTGWPSSEQMLALGSLHLLNCAVIYTAVALLARRILRSRPRATAMVTRFAGVAMTLIGAGLLVERLIAGH
ncbi:lysine transporter LysE [Microbacterium mangrovi]|uniref:Lysine transporter LysE n=1 Tax=Microbacterium mangrovi TaxID=1348253 RepID=A0A0B2A3N4_9MICO|nr:LysE family translocator [Microbacterium mangrovi]KHK96394.1 lysine transporter LysE [Microbacterium mangrovi]